MATVSPEENLSLWKELFESLQPRMRLRFGQIGDGAGNVEVAGRAGWSWIRYEENQNRLSMVRCFIGYLEDDTPVVVGKRHPDDDYEQVIGISFGPYSWDMSDYLYTQLTVPAHGETHHGTYGADPAYIDYANITWGRVRPTDPESLIVDIEAFVYGYNSETKDFDGAPLDLSGEVPAGAGHLYVLIYFDPDTESIGYEVSDTVPLATSPLIPGLTDPNGIPLSIVRLYNGQTEITIPDIWQRKLMLGSVGTDSSTPLKMIVVHEGSVVTKDGEVIWAT